MTLIDGDGAYVVPTTAREVFDVSGAGDTVMAVLAAALAFDLSRRDAVRLANLAGGIKVGKEGTQPVSDRELRQRVGGDPAMVEAAKCGDRQRVVAMVEAWRREGGNGGVISGH
jgi:D-beta-D-heptose 7-phosphate kinase/D-beta-D-heptose 1-phosphate adenosyltransferase